MVKGHIVNHTHWDREWYFTTSDATVLSEQLFTEVIEVLRKNPNANFCLDGQSSIVDEYLEVRPEKEEEIKQLVKDRRLFIGPWFTQTDALLTNGESIFRNLMIGVHDSKKYGDYMNVGYLPDTFGFNAQLPTILQNAGISNFVFWRGLDLEKHVNSPYFKWQGLSGEQVTAINMPHGYSIGAVFDNFKNNAEDYIDKRLDPEIEYLNSLNDDEDVLIPVGGDQWNIIGDVTGYLSKIKETGKYEYQISNFPDFISKIEQKNNLETVEGELREPVLARVHRTIGSVRPDIKLNNFKLEQKLMKRIEPLIVIAKQCGIDISSGLLMKLWKKVLESQAHDSLGGCVSDSVAKDILHRFKEANEMADSIENTIVKKIADNLELNENQFLLFNTDSFEFEGYKDVELIVPTKFITLEGLEDVVIIEEEYYPERNNVLFEDSEGHKYYDEPSYYKLKVRTKVNLPSMGYKVFNLRKSSVELPVLNNFETQKKKQETIKNENYQIEFNNGELSLSTSNGKIKDFISIVDSGNDGDTYDYSPLRNDEEITVSFDEASKSEYDSIKVLKVTGTSKLPLRLNDRLATNPEIGEVTINLELTLEKGSDEIKGQLTVNNQIYSHRLRLQVNTDISSEETYASLPFGYIKRKNKTVPKNWEEKFVEKPVDINIFDNSVSKTDKESTFTFYGLGLKEYENVGKDLFITLMSTTSQLGKPNLEWRPGRASGDTTKQGHIMMPTPMAEMIGEIEFNFAISVTNHPFNEYQISKITNNLMSPSISYQKQNLNFFINRLDNKIQETNYKKHLEKTFSLFTLGNEYLVTAVHPSFYDKNSYIIRIENPTNERRELDNSIMNKLNATFVNVLEQEIEAVSQINAYDVITLKCSY